MKTILSNLSMGVLVACAVIVTALVVKREMFASGPATGEVTVESETVGDWRSYVEGERMGPANAPVTIVEFSDFECPFCKATSERLHAIRAKHPREVALVYRHYPLEYHKNAALAAQASVCAARQGRFEQYHDALFAHQDSLGIIPWTRLAQAAGVPDAAAFASCLREAPPAQIERDLQAGTRLGVRGTPTLLVNDRMLRGGPPGTLERLVERALSGAGR